MQSAIRASGEAGILFVAAAGNNGTNNDVSPHYPSNYNLDNVLSVAATDHNDNLANFSNYGASTVHLAAPGVSICSSVPGGGYAWYSGTSMATPHVAGVAALAWSVDPEASVEDVRYALLQGADLLGSLNGKVATGGRLNALNTLELIGHDGPAVPYVSSLSTSPSTVAVGTAVTLTAEISRDPDDTASEVHFYHDANANGQLDDDDALLDVDTTIVDGQAAIEIDTAGFSPGTHTFFARALYGDGQWTSAARGALTVVPPDDHGDNAAAATVVDAGSSTAGEIELGGDVDFFAVELAAGQTYVFETSLGSLSDSVLYLYDRDGVTLIDYNDDISWPDNPGSRIDWIAEQSGTYFLEVVAFDGIATGTYALAIELANNVPVLEPIDDQSIGFQEDAITVAIAATDRDADPLTYEAEILATGPLAELAYELDQELGLYRHSNGYFENLFGAGEKFMASNYGWFFILPNGELYEWEGTIESSIWKATLDSSYHADPTRLHEALPPTVHEGDVTLTLEGNLLTIDPADGYVGTFRIRVQVSDGQDTVCDTFQVTRETLPATDLGTLDFHRIDGLDLSDGQRFYVLQTSHEGYLTIAADYEGSPDGVRLILYDGGFDELATDARRIDYLVGAGETYYVGLLGTNADIDLRLVNLVDHDGSIVTVHGTDGDDTFEFAASAGCELTVNGVGYAFDGAAPARFFFDGSAGSDSAVLAGSAGNDSLLMHPASATSTGSRSTAWRKSPPTAAAGTIGPTSTIPPATTASSARPTTPSCPVTGSSTTPDPSTRSSLTPTTAGTIGPTSTIPPATTASSARPTMPSCPATGSSTTPDPSTRSWPTPTTAGTIGPISTIRPATTASSARPTTPGCPATGSSTTPDPSTKSTPTPTTAESIGLTFMTPQETTASSAMPTSAG